MISAPTRGRAVLFRMTSDEFCRLPSSTLTLASEFPGTGSSIWISGCSKSTSWGRAHTRKKSSHRSIVLSSRGSFPGSRSTWPRSSGN